MPEITEERLTEIEERLRYATPGPWMSSEYSTMVCRSIENTGPGSHRYKDQILDTEIDPCDIEVGSTVFSPALIRSYGYPPSVVEDEDWLDESEVDDIIYTQSKANAQLVAHAPQDLADLIAEVRRLRAIAMADFRMGRTASEVEEPPSPRADGAQHIDLVTDY